MKPYRIFQLFTGLAVLAGIPVSWLYFSVPPNTDKTLISGASSARLLGGLGLVIVLLFFLGLLAASFAWPEKLKSLAARLKNILNSDIYHPILAVALIFVLAVNLLSLCIYYFPATSWVVPFIKTYALITVIGERTHLPQLWLGLVLAEIIAFYFLSGERDKDAGNRRSWLAQTAIASWSLTVCVLVLSIAWGLISRDIHLQLFSGPAFKLLALSAWFTVWAVSEWKDSQRTWQYGRFFLLGTIWLVVFLSSYQLAHWLNQVITPRESYWHLLADSFLKGRVYLPNPPSDQDLVFFEGHWYIPIPPLPAFIILPFVALFGVNAINTTIVSICLGALTAVLVFLIMDELRALNWIELLLSGQLWLVALFSFGTVHLWLSVVSRVWYFSQVCAVFFSALAFLFALKKYPAWVAGFCLGLALMARPNLFTLWPALAAIAIQFQIEGGQPFNWKKLFSWSFFSALPVVMAVGFLLYYNYLRFGNFFNFGYTDISSGGDVVSNARQFGIFSFHFIQDNIQTMFLALPDLNAKCNYFLPRGHGISMLAASPAIIYLFRRIRISWWTAGCWLAIILSMGLLVTYHNDGSIQYAYRYLIDFIIPVLMLIAVNAGKKVSWPLMLLILLSIAMNYYGTVSWFFSKC